MAREPLVVTPWRFRRLIYTKRNNKRLSAATRPTISKISRTEPPNPGGGATGLRSTPGGNSANNKFQFIMTELPFRARPLLPHLCRPKYSVFACDNARHAG